MKKIDIAAVPDLKTPVGIYRSTRRDEVGGPFCIAVLIGIIVYDA